MDVVATPKTIRVRGAPRRVAKAIARAVLPSSLVIWRGPARDKRIALTFDDGPTPLTRAYMDLLERFGARGTFFVVGEECVRLPQLVAEIDARGHGLGGHGFTHRRFADMPRDELLVNELGRTAALLPARARRRALVRPPFGAQSLGSFVACAHAGYTTVFWSRDSGDWRSEQARDVVAAVTAETLAAGDIVLMHDGQAWTLEALANVLPELKERGHELVTVAQLFDD